ncbi:hypothetical protein GCM10022288_26910 [Gryllotalpicola kribbensis]|uniref:Uncharacterized protein n=1 Tax=Gryllotalpicola kribbensis TaxID=993084 RepID=A0ABP8AXZ9_9MICO
MGFRKVAFVDGELNVVLVAGNPHSALLRVEVNLQADTDTHERRHHRYGKMST